MDGKGERMKKSQEEVRALNVEGANSPDMRLPETCLGMLMGFKLVI